MNTQTDLYQVIAKVRSPDPLAQRILLQVQLKDQKERPVGLQALKPGQWFSVNLGTMQIPEGLNTIQLYRRPMDGSTPVLEIENVRLIPVNAR
jgi:hypothetical protein